MTYSPPRTTPVNLRYWHHSTGKTPVERHALPIPPIMYPALARLTHTQVIVAAPTHWILRDVATGDNATWDDEIQWLWETQSSYMRRKIADVAERGFRSPIQIAITGHGNGPNGQQRARMWAGHHRVAWACSLGIRTIPTLLRRESA